MFWNPRCLQSVSVKPTTSSHSTERTSPAGSTKTGGSKSGPSLLDLIEAGMLQPGPANMKVTYKGNTYAGALQCNGTILFRGEQEWLQQEASFKPCLQQAVSSRPSSAIAAGANNTNNTDSYSHNSSKAALVGTLSLGSSSSYGSSGSVLHRRQPVSLCNTTDSVLPTCTSSLNVLE